MPIRMDGDTWTRKNTGCDPAGVEYLFTCFVLQAATPLGVEYRNAEPRIDTDQHGWLRGACCWCAGYPVGNLAHWQFGVLHWPRCCRRCRTTDRHGSTRMVARGLLLVRGLSGWQFGTLAIWRIAPQGDAQRMSVGSTHLDPWLKAHCRPTLRRFRCVCTGHASHRIPTTVYFAARMVRQATCHSPLNHSNTPMAQGRGVLLGVPIPFR